MRFLGLWLILAAASAVPLSDVEVYDIEEAERHFEEFIQTFERNYETEEEKMMRLEVFKNNLKTMNELNAKRTEDHQAVFGITSFADYTEDEFRTFVGGPIPILCKHNYNNTKIIEIKDPDDIEDSEDEFDWRKKNKVTSVKDQGKFTNSTWIFSAAACIESALALQHNKIFDISEQQAIDCSGLKSSGYTYHDECYDGFRSYIELGGIMTEKDYPYKNKKGECMYDVNKSVAHLFNFFTHVNLYGKPEIPYYKSCLTRGPMLIGVAADGWQHYKKGIFEGYNDAELNHSAQMVGYGKENGVLYWIVKNSWSTNWGEEGYIRLKAGVNTCNTRDLIPAAVFDISLV